MGKYNLIYFNHLLLIQTFQEFFCKRKSSSCYRREVLMKKLEVPMLSEIIEELEMPLSTVFFDQCPCALKKDVGIDPKLLGPTGELWIAPSDILLGRVVLTPPYSSRYIRALTHQGLLGILNTTGHFLCK